MMDEYIIIYQGSRVLESIHPTLESAREDFEEHVHKYPQDSISVRKMNMADGTCIDVTGDMAVLTFPAWDDEAEDGEWMPYVYAKLNFERAPAYDNREHAADYQAWAMPRRVS